MINFNYFMVFKNIDKLIENFVIDEINIIYSSIYSNIEKYINDEIDEKEIKLSKNDFFQKYMEKQINTINKGTEYINSHSYENLSLYAVCNDVKKFFTSRRSAYAKIKGDFSNSYSEKKILLEVMDNSLKYFKLMTNSNLYEYKKNILKIISNDESNLAIDVIIGIKEEAINENIDSIYKLYEKSVNDFFTLIKKNIEEDIKKLKIFIDVIKDFNERFDNFSNNDDLAIQQISKYIVEMNDFAVNCMWQLNNLILKNIISKDKFKGILNLLEKKEKDSGLILVADFEKNLDDNLKKLEYGLLLNLMENSVIQDIVEISNVISFSQEITEIFETITAYTENTMNFCDDKVRRILQGIKETMLIKIATLKDGLKTFENNVIEPILTINKNKILDLRKEAINNYIEDITKKVEAETIYLDNDYKIQVMDMKKDKILKELSTFEEIINHSVGELRDYSNVEVISFVNFMDSITLEINNLLLKNNIEKIFPEINEKFNSKEHTVLIAEKQKGFNKGEIIKVISSGYKYKDEIIMKANVVAGR